MSSMRVRWAIYQAVLTAILSFVPMDAAEAQIDHTGNYRGFGRFFCGPDWSENTINCDFTIAPRTQNEIADLVGEFARQTVLSAFEDEIAEADLIERGFFRLCEENPARCLGWVADFARTGSLDGDIDGVLDGADACPDTSTAISQAQAILLSQEIALLEVEQVFRRFRERLIQGANGTLGRSERASLGESLIPLFEELVIVGNKKVAGRYVFGGDDTQLPPFQVLGRFEDPEGPRVIYQGATAALELPIGPSGELRAISVPSRRAFLGDLDLDGRYPDTLAADFFDLIKRARIDLISDDLDAIRARLQEFDEAIGVQFGPVVGENQIRFAATKRIYPSPERSKVDPAGCNQAQFCSAITIVSKKDMRECVASDFLNDEPLRRSPRDCRVKHVKRGQAECVRTQTQAKSTKR